MATMSLSGISVGALSENTIMAIIDFSGIRQNTGRENNIMPISSKALHRIMDRPTLFAFLRNDLGWPVDAPEMLEDTFSYVWRRHPAGLDVTATISRIAPVAPDAPFTIVLIEFETRFRRKDLREILRRMREEIYNRVTHGDQASVPTIFVCATEDYRGILFARFEPRIGGQAKVSVFGWDRNQSEGVGRLLEYNLPALKMPPRSASKEYDRFRALWSTAWDVERTNREFCREYRTVFHEVEQSIAIANQARQQDLRPYTQRLFSRLMFQRFLAKKSPDELGSPANMNSTHGLPANGGKQAAYIPTSEGETVAASGETAVTPLMIPNQAFERIRGLFARWNFTISENTPLYVAVAVDPEMLGKVFEDSIAGRRKSGSYYTPRGIVTFMCRIALKHYLEAAGLPGGLAARLVDDRGAGDFREQDYRTALSALKRLRVLDPACGSGAYLLGMLHELVELRKRLCRHGHLSHSDSRSPADNGSDLHNVSSPDNQNDRDDYTYKVEIILHNLYGIERDASAVEIVRLRLLLSLAADYEGTGLEPLQEEDFNIRQGDSLLDLSSTAPVVGAVGPEMPVYPPPGAPKSLWGAQRPFHIVLANPPYLSIKHGFGHEDRAFLRQNYRTAHGQFDAYTLFLERALTLLDDHGCYAYLVPKSVLTNSNMLPTRKLLQKHGLIAIADPGPVFSAAVEPIILVGHKDSKADGQIQIYPTAYFRNGQDVPSDMRIEDLVTPAGIWNITAAGAVSELAARLRHLPTLGDLYGIQRGVECGKNDPAVLAQPRPDAAPLLRGQDLQRFHIRFSGLYVVRGADTTKFKARQSYDAPKLIVRRVANQLIAAIDLTGYHVLNTIYVVRAKPETTLSLEYVCALLNSRVLNDYFHAVFVNDDRLFPYIRKEQLAKLPIALPAAQEEAEIVSLARQMPDASPEQSTHLQEQIDTMVRRVFGL